MVWKENEIQGRRAPADKQGGGAAMAIQMVCPNIQCGRIHSFPDEARGQVIKCLRCEMKFRIPSPSKPAPKKRAKTEEELMLEEELRMAAATVGASVF